VGHLANLTINPDIIAMTWRFMSMERFSPMPT
jgi:hypothetical protein